VPLYFASGTTVKLRKSLASGNTAAIRMHDTARRYHNAKWIVPRRSKLTRPSNFSVSAYLVPMSRSSDQCHSDWSMMIRRYTAWICKVRARPACRQAAHLCSWSNS